jgi:Domain of unknown function (DUF4157)
MGFERERERSVPGRSSADPMAGASVGKRTLVEAAYGAPAYAGVPGPGASRAGSSAGSVPGQPVAADPQAGGPAPAAGEALPGPRASRFSSSLGAGIGGVQLHTGAGGAAVAAEHGALAVTIGQDIFFSPGAYQPSTPDGQHVLAHEVAHTAQQAGGTAGAQAIGDGGAGGEAAEAEADHAASAMTQGLPAKITALGELRAQRMVVLNKPAMTGNFVELTSIDYGLKRAGGPVALFTNANFSTLGAEDLLYFVAHGSIGQSGEVPTDALVARLLHKDFGLKSGIQGIVFTSCYAGKGNEVDDSDSVVAAVRGALHARFPGIPVTGARGPSVKSDKTGDDFTVWDKSKTVTLPDSLGAFPAVRVMETIFTVYYGPDFLTKYAIDRMDNPSVAQKAETATEETGHFYKEFQASIKDPPGSITLNMLIAGTWTLHDDEYQELSNRLGLSRKITVAELKIAMQRIQLHPTLALAQPMNHGTT